VIPWGETVPLVFWGIIRFAHDPLENSFHLFFGGLFASLMIPWGKTVPLVFWGITRVARDPQGKIRSTCFLGDYSRCS